MPMHINAASRLHTILEAASRHHDNEATLKVWSEIFGIDEQSQVRQSMLITERLGWMHKEWEILNGQLRVSTLSEYLYASALARVENALSPMILSTTWNNGRQYLTPETLLSIAFCSEFLADEESQISMDDMEAIKAQVNELTKMLGVCELPERLRAVIAHHIVLIETALTEYPIAGAKALREVARTALGELIAERDAVQDYKDAPEMAKLGAVWRKVNTVADVALKVDQLAQVGQKAWAFLEHLL